MYISLPAKSKPMTNVMNLMIHIVKTFLNLSKKHLKITLFSCSGIFFYFKCRKSAGGVNKLQI